MTIASGLIFIIFLTLSIVDKRPSRQWQNGLGTGMFLVTFMISFFIEYVYQAQ